MERLHKIMAEAGVASRRKCEQLIAQGLVRVNGVVVSELGSKVDPAKDVIKVRGKKISIRGEKIYLMLNKPRGYITAVSDSRGRATVMNLVNERRRIFPIGRLDLDTGGLLLLTDDGELANKLIHPRFEIRKTYLAVVQGLPSQKDLANLRNGVVLEDGVTAPAQVIIRKKGHDRTILEIDIHQGRKRQIRRMCQAINHPVVVLKRIRFGPLRLGRLPVGRYRMLRKSEQEALVRATATEKAC